MSGEEQDFFEKPDSNHNDNIPNRRVSLSGDKMFDIK